MTDALAQFRTDPISSSKTTIKREREEYVAFDAKDKVDRVRIRRANGPTRSPGYAYLLDVVYDGPYGTNFALVYTFLMVLVRGRNLQPVIAAVEMGMADFIQEFDSDRWATPVDSKAPIIDSIEVVVQENATSVADAEKSGESTPSKRH